MAAESSQHFLIKNWDSINDISVLEKIFSTEFFYREMEPVQPNLSHYNKVLLIAPHQDDESIGCGGLLHKLKRLNAAVTILYTTDGAQDNLGVSAKESVEVRNRELSEALKGLKVRIEKLDISNLEPKLSLHHIKSLTDLIQTLQPDLILLPWFLDIPVKHRLTNHMLLLSDSIISISDHCEIWGYQVHNHLYPNIVIDITDHVDDKSRMIDCFKSQNVNFKDYRHLTIGLNAYNSKFLKRANYAELFFGMDAQGYLSIVKKFYSEHLKEIYRGDQQYIQNVISLEKEIDE
ncbi:PIG-L deacetylase family protein [Portibacter marinus]|uniref:PIG-L deacetylase family protein n=1 Tax=Portibacter marinus TaxID=2898660 RepID=UPI001F41C59C|nr:PIG-L deacetylase family protein [Portibacter marinus]